MADLVKQLKDRVWLKKREVETEEKGRDEWATMLATAVDQMALLGSGPDFDAMKGIQAEAEATIALHETALTRLRSELAALQAELPQSAQPTAPKFDVEKHPLLRKTLEKPEPEKPVVFSTGDLCEAQWTDRSWYRAKIQSILGSAAAPKYLVRFVEYDDTLTVDASAVRPVPMKRKRDPEPAAPAAPVQSAASVVSNPHVISGPASKNPGAAVVKSAPIDAHEPRQRNKLPNKGQLKKTVGSWKDFQNKGIGKKLAKRESMFRTSTQAGSRVGFTGSGKGMTETNKRVRYERNDDVDEDDGQ